MYYPNETGLFTTIPTYERTYYVELPTVCTSIKYRKSTLSRKRSISSEPVEENK